MQTQEDPEAQIQFSVTTVQYQMQVFIHIMFFHYCMVSVFHLGMSFSHEGSLKNIEMLEI
jgi:hypothetical protein